MQTEISEPSSAELRSAEFAERVEANRRFRLVLIKPSHYDNDGYVIRWWRGGLPSNSLACLYGIALECRERQVLGADFDIDIEAIDETNWKVSIGALARSNHGAQSSCCEIRRSADHRNMHLMRWPTV